LPTPSVAKQSSVLLSKAVPPSLPLNPVNNNDDTTIDLTGNDDVVSVVPNRLSLEKSPIKIIQRAAVNTNMSSGSSSTQQVIIKIIFYYLLMLNDGIIIFLLINYFSNHFKFNY